MLNTLVFTELTIFAQSMITFGVDYAKNTPTFKALEHVSTNEDKFVFAIPAHALQMDENLIERMNFEIFLHHITYDDITKFFNFYSIDGMFRGIVELLEYALIIQPENADLHELLNIYTRCLNIIETSCFADEFAESITNMAI